MKWRFRLARAEAEEVRAHGAYVPAYAAPDLERIHHPDPAVMQLTWIGHSTFLIQVAGMNILTDPIWSERASPVSWAGPKRYARPGITLEQLPKIDLVLISHTHYDHLDRPTVLSLGNTPHYIVPPGVGEWFAHEGIDNVSELPWWQRTHVQGLTIHATPAKHWSKRKVFGTEEAGWGGYVIDSPLGRIYFAGDTGAHPQYFKDIGERFAPIALGLIPIGAYYPKQIFGTYHIDPREAITVHQEVGAMRSVGIHWGVFRLTQEPLDEPPKLLAKELASANLPPESFTTMQIGETRTVPATTT